MYRVGDVVTIRSWKSLVNEFGTYADLANPVLSGVSPYFSRIIADEVCGKSFETTDLGGHILTADGWVVGIWAIDELKTGSWQGR